MNRFQRLAATGQRGLHLILICIISLTLVLTGDSLAQYPAKLTLSTLYYPFLKVKQTLADLIGVASENEQLHKSLVEASIKVSMLEEALRENIRLRDALGFEAPPGYTIIPAELVSVTGGQVPMSVTVYHGATTGVYDNQPVINREGLIGRVVAMAHGYSTVELLTNPANRVAVRLTSSREMGIVRYVATEGLILDNFPVEGKIQVGDTVVSSGLGGVYPPGLLVGTVASIKKPSDSPYSEVRLRPAVDFLAIEEIFLLRSTRQ